VKKSMQSTLDRYEIGILVSDVNLQDAQPPEEVQAAFSDAIKAREDKERLKNEAETYANEVIPKARGRAARQTQEAQAYKESLIAKSQGEASRFNALLEEYKKAPEVTRDRLYLETMETVLRRTNKVIIDSDNANNLMYLPLDQLMKQNTSKRSGGTNVSDAFTGTLTETPTLTPQPSRSPRRTRETR
ncbi:HflK protein, partial [hydrothermal vent metagenome]